MVSSHAQSRTALGSELVLTVVSTARPAILDEIFRQLWLEIYVFEQRFSRFLPDSELSQFNRAAGAKQPITPEFHNLLKASQEMSRLTRDLYNPFILPALQRAGYTKSWLAAHQHDEVDEYKERSVVSPKRLEVGDTWARIPYGTAIDVGGSGKGYIGDALAERVIQFPEVHGYNFSLGGDIVAGGFDETGRPWTALVAGHGNGIHQMAGTATLPGPQRHAIATSAITKRKGVTAGKPWHHIIDPRTGRSAETDVLAATVVAGSALIADVLATCMIIHGSSQAEAYFTPKGVLGAVLQKQDGAIVGWGNHIHLSHSPLDHTSSYHQ